MHYFNRLFVALIFITPVSLAHAQNDVQKPSEQLSHNQIANEMFLQSEQGAEKAIPLAESVVEPAQDPNYELVQDITIDPDFDVLKAATGEDQSPLFDALQNVQKEMDLSAIRNQTKYPKDMYMFILVSLSIPAENLQAMMYDMAYAFPDKKIVLVFRGALNNDISALVNYVWNYQPPGMEVSVVIDPTVFHAFEPAGVPFYAIQVKQDDWRSVIGNVPISQAIQYSEKDNYQGEPVGRIYPINEPDMLTEIYKRIEEIDWNEQIQNAEEKVLGPQAPRVDITHATESYRYLVDPTVTIEQDIYAHNDQLIVAQGQQINPLKYMPLTKRYIFVDVTSPEHVELLRYLRAEYPTAKVISSALPSATDRIPLHEEFGVIYQIDPLIHERFGLEHVPSIVYQKGDMLAVDVIAIDDFIGSIKDDKGSR